MSVSKAAVPKHTQNPRKNPWNLKNIAFIEFLEFFCTKYILFYQTWLNISQDISQNAKIAFNFLPDFNKSRNVNIRKLRLLSVPWQKVGKNGIPK